MLKNFFIQVFILIFLTIDLNSEPLLPNFIPYGTEYGDILESSYLGKKIEKVPYFNNTFSRIYINGYGIVLFDNSVLYFDRKNIPNKEKYFFAPYLAKSSYYSGKVYYREIIHEKKTLDNISKEIHNSFKFFKFKANYSIVVTWHKKPSFYNDYLINTFQCVLATNGKYSFLIFNYNKLEYSLSYKDFYDSSISHYAQAGINTGDGETYYSIENSYTSTINETLLTKSNVNIPGKFIFRVDKYDPHSKLEDIEKYDFQSSHQSSGLKYRKIIVITIFSVILVISVLTIVILKYK